MLQEFSGDAPHAEALERAIQKRLNDATALPPLPMARLWKNEMGGAQSEAYLR
jgi:hypothetical protein